MRADEEGRDHPRMRGEKLMLLYNMRRVKGSPPHARGKAICNAQSCGKKGITPACAGKSCDIVNQSIDLGDHPRMRGEKFWD